MDKAIAIQTISALADGVDPLTGDIFDDGSPYQHPTIIRALHAALVALQANDMKSTLAVAGATNVRRIDVRSSLTPDERHIYERLSKWRMDQAKQENIAPFVIAHNSQLVEMIKLPVKTPADLCRIHGFGRSRANRYGEEIASIISGHPHLTVL